MPFDPRQHLVSLKGRDYLPVAARLMWLNAEAKRFSIETTYLALESTHAIARATVTVLDDAGAPLRSATGTKREDRADFPDFEAKAETGAVGRALGMLGFGTQFAPEFDELEGTGAPRPVDAPQPAPTPPEPATPARRPTAAAARPDPEPDPAAETAAAPPPAADPEPQPAREPVAAAALNVPGLTTASRIGAPTNKRKPVAPPDPEPDPEPTLAAAEDDEDHAGRDDADEHEDHDEYDHGSVSDEDLFGEAKVRRLLAIAGKLFNLRGDALEARLCGAASKILDKSVADIHALHWRDGNEVMRALEEQAVKRGLWDPARA